MTECERIIKEGILPERFFKPETICDFYVDESRKKLWAIQIDLYLEFERVCKEHNLRYYAIGGTLLGAVRHKGFIPWDDDIDICMPRKDYDILCNQLYSEFKSPYFLQTPKTSPGYYISFAKFRNSNTTSISLPFKNAMFNQGVAIDIFPLDYSIPEEADEYSERINESIMKCSSYMKRGSEAYLNTRQLENYKKYQTDDPLSEFEKLTKLATRIEKSDYLAVAVCTVYPAKRLVWPADCFESTVMMDYENIKMSVPAGWDQVLKIGFGNYMEFPPVDKRGCWHTGYFLDLDKSYLEYQESNGGGYKQCVLDAIYRK